MLTLLTIVHFLVCIFLIVIVLLQHGKGADMGATFGGSGKTVFGTEGPLPLLNKITTTSAIIFMFTSVTLAYYSANTSKSSVMKSLPISKAADKGPAVSPVPVEIPMTDNKPTPAGEKAPAPAAFPGTKAPAAEPTKPATTEQSKEAAAPATPTVAPAAPAAAPAATETNQATAPVPQPKETAPAPTPGK